MAVRSEIDFIRQVMIHSPGSEHNFTLPRNTREWIEDENGNLIQNPDYLLFDDIISPSRMSDEHDELEQVLMAFTGADKTIQFQDLLIDTINNKDHREELFSNCCELDQRLYGTNNFIETNVMMDMEDNHLATLLLSGRILKPKINTVFKWPLPNLIFTRDIAVALNKSLIITWGKWPARQREMLLMAHIAKHHPLFSNYTQLNFHEEFPDLFLEGGDYIVLDKETLLIGLSERNSKESIEAILPLTFGEGFKRVLVVDLPKTRSMMHLDTLFSRISNDEIIVFPPLFNDNEINGHQIQTFCIEQGKSIFDIDPVQQSLSNCLKEYGYNFQAIHCGGDEPVHQEREQWSDGANAFTLSPGKIISYSRNHETSHALKEAGYEKISAKDFIRDSKKYISTEKKMLITISSSELPRGRGGPRCLTMPLDRS